MQRSGASPNRSHRGEAVVHDVLEAAHEELARVGYRALRVEDVAARANVNRTTIYRRWATKAELVAATLRATFDAPDIGPSTGTLRGDLLLLAKHALAFLTSPDGQVFVKMMMAEGTEPELRAIVDEIRKERELVVAAVFDQAKARGEMRPEVPSRLVVQLLFGGLNHCVFALGMDAASVDIAAHVDLVLHGALVPAK